MRALAAMIGIVGLLVLAGCSSHEPRYEDRVPPSPKPASTRDLVDAAGRIAERYRRDAGRLPADALAPLTQASAIGFRVSGAPGLRMLTSHYADMLLASQLERRGGSPFFGAASPNRADAAITADSVDALVDAYVATRDPRYRQAAIEGATALKQPSLGLTPARGGLMMRVSSRGTQHLSVALTAQVARVLDRVGDPFIGGAATDTRNQLLRAVARAQQGLGRWYAFVGSEVPMNMEQWAMTLLSVASVDGRSPVAGIAASGITALFDAGFTPTGEPDLGAVHDRDGYGSGLAISTFDAYADAPRYALLVTQRALERRREDGTVMTVSRDDARVQGVYAVGFARRALSSRREGAG